jgi:hypothetical protein
MSRFESVVFAVCFFIVGLLGGVQLGERHQKELVAPDVLPECVERTEGFLEMREYDHQRRLYACRAVTTDGQTKWSWKLLRED